MIMEEEMQILYQIERKRMEVLFLSVITNITCKRRGSRLFNMFEKLSKLMTVPVMLN